MNIRIPLALTLALASSLAMAASNPTAPTAPAKPAAQETMAAAPATAATAATPATPAKHVKHASKKVAHRAVHCKKGQSKVDGKCEKAAATS